MKALLILCIVVTVAFASVVPDDFDLKVLKQKDGKDGKDDKKDDFPVTEEEIDCIKDGAYAIWDKRPDLNDWFTGAEVDAYDLLDRLYDCYEKTGLRRKFCVGKLTASTLAFYYRINKSLGNENGKVMKKLKGVVEDCLDIKVPILFKNRV